MSFTPEEWLTPTIVQKVTNFKFLKQPFRFLKCSPHKQAALLEIFLP